MKCGELFRMHSVFSMTTILPEDLIKKYVSVCDQLVTQILRNFGHI